MKQILLDICIGGWGVRGEVQYILTWGGRDRGMLRDYRSGFLYSFEAGDNSFRNICLITCDLVFAILCTQFQFLA